MIYKPVEQLYVVVMQMQKESILLTGGAGYIGSHAALALLDADWPVVILDSLVTGVRSLVPGNAKFIQGDAGNHALVLRIIEDYNIKSIMHFAGSLVVPEAVLNPLKYYHNNTTNTCELLKAAVAGGVKHFVFSSTAAVYGITGVDPVTEISPTVPINPYGMSKLMSEYMIRDVASAFPINYGILRYFNVAGADPFGRSGQSTKGASSLIKIAAEVAAGKRQSLCIFGDDYNTFDGTGVRDYIHVSDLAEAHVKSLSCLMQNPDQSHTLNCGYGQGYSVRQVIDCLEQVSDAKLNYTIAARRPGDPDFVIASNDAIKEKLGWQPKHNSLKKIIRSALDWEINLENIKMGSIPAAG